MGITCKPVGKMRSIMKKNGERTLEESTRGKREERK